MVKRPFSFEIVLVTSVESLALISKTVTKDSSSFEALSFVNSESVIYDFCAISPAGIRVKKKEDKRVNLCDAFPLYFSFSWLGFLGN